MGPSSRMGCMAFSGPGLAGAQGGPMIDRIARLPLRVARKLYRGLFPRGSHDGGVSYTPAATGLRRPPEAVRAAPKPASAAQSSAGGGDGPGDDPGDDRGDDPGQGPASSTRAAVRVHAEATPNPDALKFTLDRRVVDSGSLSFSSAEDAAGHPLGRAIFAVPGVRSAFAVHDFVTVTKDPDASWTDLRPALEEAIRTAL
ncbi:MAG: hypothetical protein D6798_16430 [Deltaproteobacteria bacterium]|nr:MAG: hypothetical protein D6798_16430 [Deltaproteobacteria bacterium]